MPVRIDVTQERSVIDALVEAERNFGKLHIACNNAGVPMHGTKMADVERPGNTRKPWWRSPPFCCTIRG